MLTTANNSRENGGGQGDLNVDDLLGRNTYPGDAPLDIRVALSHIEDHEVGDLLIPPGSKVTASQKYLKGARLLHKDGTIFWFICNSRSHVWVVNANGEQKWIPKRFVSQD